MCVCITACDVLVLAFIAGSQFFLSFTLTTVFESSGQISIDIVRVQPSTEITAPVNITVSTMSGTAISESATQSYDM